MNNKQFLTLLICAAIFAFIGGFIAVSLSYGSPAMAQQSLSFTAKEFSLPENHFIGIVENGKLRLIVPKTPMNLPVRLTTIGMQEARAVDSGEIDLNAYEGKALLFTGHDGGGWIYQANIIDSGSPLLTILVKKVFP